MAHEGAKVSAKLVTLPLLPYPPAMFAYTQLALSMFVVGLCVTAGKAATEHLPVIVLAGVRCTAAAIALWPLARGEGPVPPMTGGERRDLALQALFGVFGFTLLMLGGVQLTGATEAGLIAATMPLAILVLAMPLLGEGISPRALRAALVACVGIALVSGVRPVGPLAEATPDATAAWLGNALIVGAVVCEALYTIFAKRLSSRLPPATMALRLNLVGLAMFVPFMPFQPWVAVLQDAPPWVWALGALYGVGTSAVALVLWYRGTRSVRGGTAGLFTVFLPVGATLSAVLFLGETIEARHVAGGIVIGFALVAGLARRRGGGVRPWREKPKGWRPRV